jgi:dihydrofolate reductase
MAAFAEMTAGRAVIVGRRTWDEIPAAGLPGRKVIVLSGGWEAMSDEWRKPRIRKPGFFMRASNEYAAIKAAEMLVDGLFAQKPIWIIGGADAYWHFLQVCDGGEWAVTEAIITHVLAVTQGGAAEGVTRFPSAEFDEHEWQPVEVLAQRKGSLDATIGAVHPAWIRVRYERRGRC